MAKKIIIKGFVQGVGFRYAMCAQATNIGATGWVANKTDGTVEAMVQGTEDQVNALIEWAKKGPPGARVSEVEVSEGSGIFKEFEISYI